MANIGRPPDFRLASNRNVFFIGVPLSFLAFLILGQVAPLVPFSPPLESDSPMYRLIGGLFISWTQDPETQLRALRFLNAGIGAIFIFGIWALAREVYLAHVQIATFAMVLGFASLLLLGLATTANSLMMEVTAATLMLMMACRVGVRSSGRIPSLADYGFVAVLMALTNLTSPRLWPLAILTVLAFYFDAGRSRRAQSGVQGALLVMAGVAAGYLWHYRPITGTPVIENPGINTVVVLVLFGLAIVAGLPANRVAETAANDDSGGLITSTVVRFVRLLSLGWVIFCAFQGWLNGDLLLGALLALPVLVVETAAGAYALRQRADAPGM